MMDLHPGLTAAIGALVGTLLGVAGLNMWLGRRKQSLQALTEQARAAAVDIRTTAEHEAVGLRDRQLTEAREEAKALREEVRHEVHARRAEAEKLEQRLTDRENRLGDREQRLLDDERALQSHREGLDARGRELAIEQAHVVERTTAIAARLEQVAGLTREEAAARVREEVEAEARAEAAAHARQIREQGQRDAERDARRLLAMAAQRMASDYTAETTVSVVTLPSDDMKGRIIGREGRNIRAFELATGVDVIIDDTPDSVVVSCFDPVRREIARRALEALVADGRIHPGRIEELVTSASTEIDAQLMELGEKAAFDLGVHGLAPELIKLVGRMRYRTSYGQNLYEHSKEVAWLAGMMAAELHADVALARRGGLLHDIGKVLTHEHEGTHVELGVEVARRHGEQPLVLNAIGAHHDDVPHESTESVLVQTADSMSGARPGARREAFDSYVKRLARLEEIAGDYAGVERTTVIQAGREVRVIVKPETISDAAAEELSETIARRIEAELQYPGQIRVTVIRETRATGVAK
ncbi:MAG: ribonuclease Y [Gemmatimonadota bacterium]